tara:strand:- start:30421 stop:31611 length:1191 start_codon:yes stop_codon:yes gene_type:complete
MRRGNRRSGHAEPTGITATLNDLLLNSMLVIVLILAIVVTAIGVPDVSAQVLREFQSRAKNLQALNEGLQEELSGESAARAAAEQARERAELAEQQAANQRAEAERVAESARQQAERASRVAQQANHAKDQAQASASEAKRERDDAVKEAEGLRPKPVDVVLVIDGTESMDSILRELRTACKVVAEIGSRLSPRFRLGIVVYRGRGNSSIFPLTEITQTVNGRMSTGMQSLARFTDDETKRVSIVSGSRGDVGGSPTGQSMMVSEMEGLISAADVEFGLRSGVGLLDAASSQTNRQVLIVMGDVGPWEFDGRLDSISGNDRQSAQRALITVQRFVQSGPDRRVLALFTGSWTLDLKHKTESVRFFHDLAAQAASRGVYSDDTSQIAAAVVDAVVGQ